MHATFWKPASSNLFAAAVDLPKEGKIQSPILILRYKYQVKYSKNSCYANS
jgi:hypothetical protein